MVPPVDARATFASSVQDMSQFFSDLAALIDASPVAGMRDDEKSMGVDDSGGWIFARFRRWMRRKVRGGARRIFRFPGKVCGAVLRRASYHPLRFVVLSFAISVLIMLLFYDGFRFVCGVACFAAPALSTFRFLARDYAGTSEQKQYRLKLHYVYWLVLCAMLLLESLGRWFPIGPDGAYLFLKTWLFLWMYHCDGVARFYEYVVCPFAKRKHVLEKPIFLHASENVDAQIAGEETTKRGRSSTAVELQR